MIHIQFNTHDITPSEVRALQTLLAGLQPVESREIVCPAVKAAQDAPAEAESYHTEATYEVTVPEKIEGAESPEPKKRRGRPRKEEAQAPEPEQAIESEIVTDNTDTYQAALSAYRLALKEGGATEDQIAKAVAIWASKGASSLPDLLDAIELTKQPKAEAPKPATGKSFDQSELRAALMVYTGKHGMSAGLELLNKFGKQRISEISELDSNTQGEFVEACNA